MRPLDIRLQVVASNDADTHPSQVLEDSESNALHSIGDVATATGISPDTIREHGALAGAPIGKITPVNQTAY